GGHDRTGTASTSTSAAAWTDDLGDTAESVQESRADSAKLWVTFGSSRGLELARHLRQQSRADLYGARRHDHPERPPAPRRPKRKWHCATEKLFLFAQRAFSFRECFVQERGEPDPCLR